MERIMSYLVDFILSIRQMLRRKRHRIKEKTVVVGRGIKIYTPSEVIINKYVKLRDYIRINGNVSIGNNSDLRSFTFLDARGGFINIGNNCSINDFSIIYGMGGVTIGDDVRIATHTVIISGEHNFNDRDKLIRLQGVRPLEIIIEDNVWIGANVTILGGSKVGNGSIIGAGSVVTKSIPPFSVAVGNPAKVLKTRV